MLKSAGWKVTKTFDVNANSLLSPNATGTTPDISVSSLGHSGSWFIIQQPTLNADGTTPPAPFAGSRQYLFVRGADDQHWYISYSRTGIYANGAAAVFGNPFVSAVIPYATDEVGFDLASRSGSDHGISGISFSHPLLTTAVSTGGTHLHVAATTSAPFAFYFVNYPSGQAPNAETPCTTAIFTEAMAPGSFSFDSNHPTDVTVSDLDPIVHFVANPPNWAPATGGALVGGSVGSKGKMWYSLNTANVSWKTVGGAGKNLAGGASIPNNAGFDPVTGNIVLVPIEWGNNVGLRGVGLYYKWPSANMVNAQLCSSQVNGDRICFDDLIVPWPGEATTPLN
jgi:hypothetical protein